MTTTKISKVISSNLLDWKKRDKPDPETPCYVLLAKPTLFKEDEEEDEDEDDDDDTIVSYHISAMLYGKIKNPRAERPEHMKIVNSV